MTSAFDAVASRFERFRILPNGVPQAIRTTVLAAAHTPSPPRILDLGAGTGRIGRTFVEAGDFYVGVDTSLAMLQEFQASTTNALLAQADGRQLPFRDGAFDVVMLMHVLSGTGDWQPMLNEVRRVCHAGGIVAVGHTVSSEVGIDAQLKHQLKTILQEMGVSWHRPQESYRRSLDWLRSLATRHVHAQAASWNHSGTAQEFISRHRSGARFAALPHDVQEQALQKLGAWAKETFGSLDNGLAEQHSFELDIFEF
ncbi:MAG TPA: class I SAM-dependent methyltransferase [Candidatus Angelobacter sp.]|jgi:ubiquinone/menaquinone biosynthesis C-methylase UbiE